MATKLYDNVKMLCKEHKLSVRKLEIHLDFKLNTISSWARKMPSCGKVLKVANFFDVSVDFLIGNCDDRLSHKNELSKGTLIVMAEVESLNLSEDLAKKAAKLIKTLVDK